MNRTWNRFVIAMKKNRVLRLSRICAYDYFVFWDETIDLSVSFNPTNLRVHRPNFYQDTPASCCDHEFLQENIIGSEAFNRKRSPAIITLSTFTEHMHTRTHPRKISQIFERLITDKSFRIRLFLLR